VGGHDDEATSARGIVDGGEDDGMGYHTVPGEYLNEFAPGHAMSDGRGCYIVEGTHLVKSKGKPRT